MGCEQLDLSPGDTLGRVRGIIRCGKNISDSARGRRDFQNKTDSDWTQKKENVLLMGTDRTPETGLLSVYSDIIQVLLCMEQMHNAWRKEQKNNNKKNRSNVVS